MDLTSNNICGCFNLCSYNCRSIKRSLPEVQQLCEKHDLVVLQEHWLLPDELPLLSGVHADFLANGTSAVDVSNKILVGRPYGGTAILYRKSIADRISVVPTNDARLTAVKLLTLHGPVLILNVYMPTDYHDDDSLDLYLETCGRINALITDCDVVEVIVLGDFNCSFSSRMHDNLRDLMKSNKLVCSDMNLLTDAFTYCNSDESCVSWIDHILCSNLLNSLINDLQVFYEYMLSDHKPISVKFRDLLACEPHKQQIYDNAVVMQRCWDKLDDVSRFNYAAYIDQLLQNVLLPVELSECLTTNGRCNNCHHKQIITDYYNEVLCCVETAVNSYVPTKLSTTENVYNVPGWNDYVREKHYEARSAYLDWLLDGKHRYGFLFQRMQRTRATFKLALRYCRQNEEQLRADACAVNLSNKDPTKFWQSVKKISNSKATKYVDTVGSVSGEQNIAEMWRNHFQQLYNSVECNSDYSLVVKRLLTANDDKFTVCLADVLEALNKQKKGKSPGPDGLHSEAYMYGGLRLATHLCILLNLFLVHSFVPDSFMRCTIVPLVKCKAGDLTDINNYRAITLSNAITKISELVFLPYINDKVEAVDCQFGFKAGHSTSLCTYSFKHVVDYYTNRGSHVFVCFADFSKAFDKVNYWKLFSQLIDLGVSTWIVSLLAYWYSHQQVCVNWHGKVSSSFFVGNGTKQGGLLSPCLFNCYVRKLIFSITESNIGCNIGGLFTNLLAYADDMVLLAPSWRALQHLLKILEDCASDIDMVCNVNKTVCMIFHPKDKRKIVSTVFPCLRLNNVELKYVDEFKYLGYVISNDERDDKDVLREVRALFSRANILARRFGLCSVAVKTVLFKSFCMCLYGMVLWKYFSAGAINRLRSCYRRCIKTFWLLQKLQCDYYASTARLTYF